MQSAQASVLKCAQMHLHCMISSALCAKQRCTESVYMQSFYLTLHHNCTKLFSIVNCRSCSVNAFVCTILTASIYSFHNMLMHCTALMHCTDALHWCTVLMHYTAAQKCKSAPFSLTPYSGHNINCKFVASKMYFLNLECFMYITIALKTNGWVLKKHSMAMVQHCQNHQKTI